MSIYSLWNNKGGVGKSYLTFQLACEYARINPQKKVLVVDLCPQANSSSMLLGGIENGEVRLESLAGQTPAKTISGYIADRIVSPYVNPRSGAQYLTQISAHNRFIPSNLFLVSGDETLELQSTQVQLACTAGPADAWRIVHTWISDLVEDIRLSWDEQNITVFIDCNPSFTIYTEMAMSASDNLLIPFSADGSSKRAVKSVLSLVYGIQRQPGQIQSEFYRRSSQYRMALPRIYAYVGNRLTQMNSSSASAFKTIVKEVFAEVYKAWLVQPNIFNLHPPGVNAPGSRREFQRMFEIEIKDANSASVVSGSLGIPICRLTAGNKIVAGRTIKVNQSQLDKQQPNIRDFANAIL